MKKASLDTKNKLGLTLASFGHTIFISLTSMALPMFLTDVMFVNPATVSTIFLVTRVWDAINDPMMGVLVDKTNTRWGKCRPYLLYGAVPLLVLTVLMFMPHSIESDLGKGMYAFITYALFITAFTAIDIPMAGCRPRMFVSPESRNKASSFINTFGSLGSLFAVDLFFVMVVLFGGGSDKRGYFITVILLAIVAFATLLGGFFTTKEVIPADDKRIKLKEAYKIVLKNKFLMLAIIMSVCSIGTSAYGILLPYFSKWNLADSFSFGAFSVESVLIPVLSTATGVIYMVAIFITPYLLKIMDKKKLFILVSALGAVFNVISYFVGYQNMFAFMALRMLAHIPPSICAALTGFMVMDSLDYAEHKDGQRVEGTTFAVNNLISKIANAVFSSLVMLMLAYFGYNAAISEASLKMGESISHHYKEMLGGIFAMMSLMPAVSCVIQIVPMLFYKLDDKRVKEIADDLAKRREAQNEGITEPQEEATA